MVDAVCASDCRTDYHLLIIQIEYFWSRSLRLRLFSLQAIFTIHSSTDELTEFRTKLRSFMRFYLIRFLEFFVFFTPNFVDQLFVCRLKFFHFKLTHFEY